MILDKGCPDVLCEECQEYCEMKKIMKIANFMYLDGTVCGGKRMKFNIRNVKFIWNKKLEGKIGYVANNIN